MKVLMTLFVITIGSQTMAQDYVKKNIEVGDYLRTANCKKGQKEFESMDVYARTHPFDKNKIDTTTGDGLLQEFFSDKSIDAKRLPCSMGGKRYKVAALHTFQENGRDKNVVLLYTAYPLTLIWVELDKAIEKNEIIIQ